MSPQWKIFNNTDATDIDQNCIGLDPMRSTFPKDVADHIHTNRGLHVQIRHNKDPQTFAQAIELSRLIAAVPEMYEALKYLQGVCIEKGTASITPIKDTGFLFHIRNTIESALAKAEGNNL